MAVADAVISFAVQKTGDLILQQAKYLTEVWNPMERSDFGVQGVKDEERAGSSSDKKFYRRTYSHKMEQNVVGLEEDTNLLLTQLRCTDCRVVSICGMAGLGKTTLAKKVYHQCKVGGYLGSLVWIFVSQQWGKTNIWETILYEILYQKSLTDEEFTKQWKMILEKKDEGVAKLLHDELGKKKCLVVLDDIWHNAWEILSPGFPTETSSKFMITTRNKSLAHGFIHEPKCLNDDELATVSYKMDERMATLGRKMLKHCGGLPLAIIVLGGVERQGEETLEDIGYRYLTELAERYMIVVAKRDSIGRIKRFPGDVALECEEYPPFKSLLGFSLDQQSGLSPSLTETLVHSFKLLRILDLQSAKHVTVPWKISKKVDSPHTPGFRNWLSRHKTSLLNRQLELLVDLKNKICGSRDPTECVLEVEKIEVPISSSSDRKENKKATVCGSYRPTNAGLVNFPTFRADVQDLITPTNLRRLKIQAYSDVSLRKLQMMFMLPTTFDNLRDFSISKSIDKNMRDNIKSCCPRLLLLKSNREVVYQKTAHEKHQLP
ncbi:hypothetical protein V6N13_016535 [Hibiscus sabdariffa]